MIENNNELRLGNYIEYNKHYMKIHSISGPLPRPEPEFDNQYVYTIYCNGLMDVSSCDCNYVKLSNDILRKFGFNTETCTLKIEVPSDSEHLYFGKDYNGNIRLIQGEYYIGKPIEYLHELQNLYYDLSGKELELWVLD